MSITIGVAQVLAIAVSFLGVIFTIVGGVWKIAGELAKINQTLVRLDVGKVSHEACHDRRGQCPYVRSVAHQETRHGN